MKHAYLIIAHNEFEVLQRLVKALDDSRNDIYVHIDRKVKVLPELDVEKSRFFMVSRRIDVRWGHVSQIESEFVLFEEALRRGRYDYYHLISGTHHPLVPLDDIDHFFESMNGCSVMTDLVKDTEYQETLKIHRINLFLRNYASSYKLLSSISQFLWKSFIAFQRVMHISINVDGDYYKASNWISLTYDALRYIVERKKDILRKYRFSLCGDEFFVPSELMQSDLRNKVVSSDRILKQEILRANTRVYRYDDLERLRESSCLFARKFTSR